MSDYSNLIQAILEGNDVKCVELTNEALDEGASPGDIVSSGLQAGMLIVGDKFSAGDFFIPDMLLAARAVARAMEAIRPCLSEAEMPTLGRVVIGTVSGDIHDIGKNLVAAMLEVSGFEVSNLGSDCPNEKFIDKAEESGANIIAMSSLMATTMFYQKDVINYLKDAGLRRKYWVMVGGGTVTPEWTTEIGADGYGRNATDAVEVAKMLMEKGEELKKPIIKE